MPRKHPFSDDHDDSATSPPPYPNKRARLSPSCSSPADAFALVVPRTTPDLLSPLSDELLIRILSYLSLPHLLAVAPVSRRYHRLAQDSQLWKALYYARFVLPRAMRIPGFRGKASVREHKLHYKGRRNLWADGRLGGVVRKEEEEGPAEEGAGYPASRLRIGFTEESGEEDTRVNWKRQFKIRHNWARGKCAVEELKLGPNQEAREGVSTTRDHGDEGEDRSKMLVKVVEGLAVTADATFGLRVWELKTREVAAQMALRDERHKDESAAPSCLAIDDRGLEKGILDISVGFTDGSFGVWQLREHKTLVRRYRHEKSSNGELVGMSYSHPYLLTATAAVLVSLYTFNVPEKMEADDEDDSETEDHPVPPWLISDPGSEKGSGKSTTHAGGISLPAPFLMTSLKSHTSDPPLALSIRKTGNITVASIAYTFFTRQGWSIGIQDLHITPNTNPARPPSITTRLAYTTPVQTGPPRPSSPSTPLTATTRTHLRDPSPSSTTPSQLQPPPPRPHATQQSGPTTLSYTHPYLLATLPDNTLILHLCTSTAAILRISPGIRLWGHTSGISDADITARGKAVSVSSRGDEMRVWELEGGRPSGLRSSRSVEIRADGGKAVAADVSGEGNGQRQGQEDYWEERRNWVGFDDEMVIVLKETKGKTESLMVYDFT